MKALGRLSASEIVLLARDPGSLFFMLAFPIMLLVLNSGNDSLEIFFPSYLAMILAIGGIAALPGILASYRERKVLRRLAITPVSPVTLLLAQVGAQVLMGLIGSVLLFAVGLIAFDVDLPAHPLPLALAFVVCSLMTCSIGFVIASFAPNDRAANLIGMVVMFPMIFLSGAAVPPEALNSTLRRIGDWLPLTQGVQALRDGWFGTPEAFPLLVMAGIIAVCMAIAGALFRWD